MDVFFNSCSYRTCNLNRHYTYPAMALIFDRISPAYSVTRAFSTSRSLVSFTQVSDSTHSSKNR